jgi:hypothetical protein
MVSASEMQPIIHFMRGPTLLLAPRSRDGESDILFV